MLSSIVVALGCSCLLMETLRAVTAELFYPAIIFLGFVLVAIGVNL